MGRVDELNAQEEENEVPFVVGETVKVTDGPFSSFQGTIETVDDERKKLTCQSREFQNVVHRVPLQGLSK